MFGMQPLSGPARPWKTVFSTCSCGKAKFIAWRTFELPNGSILALSSSQIMNEESTLSTATSFWSRSFMISSGCRYCAISTAPPCSSEARVADVGTSRKITVSIAGLPR